MIDLAPLRSRIAEGRPAALMLPGDCIEVMKTLPEGSIDAIVTDPPYGLSFMGKEWDRFEVPGMGERMEEEGNPVLQGPTGHAHSHGIDPSANGAFQEWCLVWARQALRVLKPGGYLLTFGGTRTYHRVACAVEDAGFEIRDCIMWLYGSGFPKSLDVSKAIEKQKVTSSEDIERWQGWGTALKPAFEPVIVARKPLIGTVAANVLAHGTGAINIDGCRITTADNLNGGAYSGEERKRDNYSASDANAEASLTRLRRGVGEFKQPQGRWPANVILTHSDDCVCMGLPLPSMPYNPATDVVEYVRSAGPELWKCAPGCPIAELDAQSGVLTSGDLSPENNVRESSGWSGGSSASRVKSAFVASSGGASRFFYCAKPSRAERDMGCSELPASTGGEATDRKDDSAGTKSPRAGAGRTGGSRNIHPTVKPIALMRWLCRLVTPVGGIVLDPFLGSGTTLCAAIAEGFAAVGIEREAAYLPIAQARVKAAIEQKKAAKG
jgi:site-specific DNA-methyltransferase (adenine-specific)